MEKIAIIRRNGLGDLLSAYPLVLYLRKYYPKSRLSLFVDKRNAPLVPFLPPVDEVIIFPAKGNKYWHAFRTAKAHRGKYDVAISAKTSPMKLMNCFLFWLKASSSMAYTDHKWHSRLINHPLPYDKKRAKSLHQALKTLQILAPELEEIPEEFYPRITLDAKLKEKYLALTCPLKGKIVVCVSVTTTGLPSRFSLDRYAKHLNQLALETPFHLLIIGQPQDAERAEALSQKILGNYSVHFPRNFDEFMVLLDASDLYFVGDGGVAHIGAALGKKGVVLFGTTNPIEWAPLSRGMETFYHPEHVDALSDTVISGALRQKLDEVVCER